ncbi:MAG: efflux RND transporter periplasmic adaptor subunit [Cyclobacteriaceae bacterium]|nr:efflux RND transporter periplasmic adaptor subunit [Cyclobacteriaceae bacterium]
MRTNILFILGFIILSISACEQKDPLQAKKEELKSQKTKLQKIKTSITELEKEISAMDPDFAKKNRKATLITTTDVEKKTFEHYVEVSGAVKSRKNVLISAENMGNINRILVKEGNEVKRGQLLLSLDIELYQRSLDQLETEYALAKTMFEKQSNLWGQNIGTEVQYLEAKNRKESLENQIANIKTQISKSQIRAPFAGTIENVLVREGEMAQMGSPLVRIVNHQDMYIKADLSEAHIGKFKKGDEVVIYFPSINQTIQSRISSVGQIIDIMNRTFSIEALLPLTKFTIKPNLLAIVKLRDIEINGAVVIPAKLIQKDNKGDFVFIAKKDSNELIARKIQIDRGITYKNNTMITNGLTGDETLINEGFRDVADGGKVKVVENVL